MSLYVFSYDLRKKDEFDYQKLWDALEKIDSVKYQESAYFVSSGLTAKDLLNKLKSFAHENDFLMIVPFSAEPEWTKSLRGTNAWMTRFFP
ncbi:MAG: hypothetical protein ACLPIC_16885 [Rhodoblastus sp.]|uniref:hypothetical protein n=1 Tax=Rhodoblastus sp. TaxID=1962975 RepID=UPI003F9D0B2E